MAVDPEQYPGDASGHMRPELTDFVGQFGDAPWAQKAADQVQTYLTTKTIAQNAQDAGNQLVQNIGRAKDNLVNMVKTDPGSAKLALGLAPDMVDGLTEEAGHEPGAHAALAGDMQREIAHNAITTLASRNPDAARSALGSDLGGYLADGDHAGLSTYIDNQERFAQQDKMARGQQLQRDQAQASYSKASTYLNSMIHPRTGDLYMPPGLGMAVMDDPSVAISTRAAVHDVYTRMAGGQNLGTSDPFVLSDMVNRIASPDGNVSQDDLLHHIGDRISLADGAHLNAMLDPGLDMGSKQQVKSLAATLNSARDSLVTPQNGPAGRAAYGRFTNWLMPALRAGGNLGELMDGNRMQHFAPNGDDAMQGVRMAENAGGATGIDPAKVQRLRNLEIENQTPRGSREPGGTQFRRLLDQGGDAPIPLQMTPQG